MANTTRVIFSTDLTTLDGRHHKGGVEASVDFHEARDLVHRGLVQLAPSEPALPTANDDPASTQTTKGGK